MDPSPRQDALAEPGESRGVPAFERGGAGAMDWWLSELAPLPSEPARLHGAPIDIGEYHRALEHGERLHQKLVNTLESITDGFLILDRDWRFVYVNPEAERILQCSRYDLLGKSHWDVFAFTLGTVIEQHYRGVRETQTAADLEYQHVLPERESDPWFARWYSLKAYPSEEGGISIYVRDITEHKLAEQRLRASEHRYRQLVANAADAILVLQDGLIQFANARAVEITGQPADKLSHRRFVELAHPDDRDALREELRAHKVERASGLRPAFRITHASGALRWVELVAAPMVWEEQPACLCFLRDVTDKRLLEAQLLQAQRLEAMGRLAGSVAHDFNNMLSIIGAYTDILLSQIHEGDPLAHSVHQIETATRLASSLTRQVLAFGRRQTLSPEVLDLNVLIRGIEHMLRRLLGMDITLVTTLAPDLGPIKADRGQLEQVVVNLAINARDAMPLGGKLTIETANVAAREGASSALVVLAVRDSGCGMDDSTKARIFEPFFTTKEPGKGTGLGLAAVYGVVKQSGGSIDVASTPGAGSVFTLYFPRVDRP